MRLASHLGMSLQRCQAETTFTEFTKWMKFLKELRVEPFKVQDKRDLLFAMLAAEVRRSWVKHPTKVKVKDFIYEPQEVTFKATSTKKPAAKKSIPFKEKVAAIKARTFAAFGMPKEK